VRTSPSTSATERMHLLEEERRIKRLGRALYNRYMDGSLDVATLSAYDYACLKTYKQWRERQIESIEERINFIEGVFALVTAKVLPPDVLDSLEI